jgi:acyl carrier protein
MTKPAFEEVAAKIASLLKVNPERITRDTTADDVDGWDSVRHANIILTLEDTYGIQFSDEEIFEAPNVGVLFDRLIQHIAG